VQKGGNDMKKILVLSVLIFVAVIAWRIGEKLSSDAISMGIGVLFGVLAGVPTALLLLVSNRGRRGDDEMTPVSRSAHPHYPQLAAQPPVIVVTGHGLPAQSAAQQPGFGAHPAQGPHGWDQPRPERKFKVVGEQEGWVEEW